MPPPPPNPASPPTAPAPASTPTSATPAPAPAPALTHDPKRDPEDAAARADQQQDQHRNDPSHRDRDFGPSLRRRRRDRVLGVGERHPEFAGKRLGNKVDAEGETLAVLLLGEQGKHRIADPAGARIGQESFGAAAGRDEGIARAGLMALPRHQ